jgi:hypothetical protein
VSGVRAWPAWLLTGAARLRTWCAGWLRAWWSGVRGRAARGHGAGVAPGGWPEPVVEEVVVEAVLERPFPAPGTGVRAWPARLLAGLDRLRSRLAGSRGLAAPGRRIPEPAEERGRSGQGPGPGVGDG